MGNTGNKATFVNTRGFKSIIDLTLTNSCAQKLISDWKVGDVSLSDHKMITFNIDLGNEQVSYTRKYENTDWEQYHCEVKHLLEIRPFKKRIVTNDTKVIDKNIEHINKILTEALDKVCPMVKVIHKSKIPWSKEINEIKNKTLKLKKKAIHSKCEEDRTNLSYSEELYKKELQKHGKQAWRDFCTNTTKQKKLAKFPKQKRKRA